MDLSTSYLGLKLKNPLMPGASPLVDDLDTVRRLEDAGAAAIVMHSLFEEQIVREEIATFRSTESHAQSFAEAASFFPPHDAFVLGPDDYLEHLRRVKQAVGIPVIGSLNGNTPGGWLRYARDIQHAGADALELNVYTLPSDPEVSGAALEDRALEAVEAVRQAVNVPVAVKLSPFYTSLPHFARRLLRAGADGLVLFNRFYQPDIDPEELQVRRVLVLSHPSELLLRLNWLAVLSPLVEGSLAVTGGVHSAHDALRAIMAGAHAVQMTSALLKHGPRRLAEVLADLGRWLEEHEYASVSDARGCMSLAFCPEPEAFLRANYILMLQSFRERSTAR
jgi:dihydroorotate dehydrogenase (fumarate)